MTKRPTNSIAAAGQTVLKNLPVWLLAVEFLFFKIPTPACQVIPGANACL
jgi:hypothetical protein